MAQPAPHHLPVLRPAQPAPSCAAGQCCRELLSPPTLTYIHSVLKSVLEQTVREEKIS
ncbi:hypothetical protein GCM10010505_14840 [Kitasatospora aburaviensis]